MKEKKWWVYVVHTEGGKLYTGITTDLERRFREHGSGKRGARFFRFSSPLELLYQECCQGRSAALKREHAIKKLSRKEKWQLCGREEPASAP